jgi:hypothetical protein
MRRRELMPCGTEAAARRHFRHGETLDEACRVAANQAHAERRGGGDPYARAIMPAPQGPARNGLLEKAYEYGAPRPSWAVAAIRDAEARWGAPERDDGAAWDREAG